MFVSNSCSPGERTLTKCFWILENGEIQVANWSFQVLNHLHKKLRNMSKKSEASKKKVDCFHYQFLFVYIVVLWVRWFAVLLLVAKDVIERKIWNGVCDDIFSTSAG